MLFSPSYKSRAKDMLHYLKKTRRYSSDILPTKTLQWMDQSIQFLNKSLNKGIPKRSDAEAYATWEEGYRKIETRINKDLHENYRSWAIRENVEVILVAIVLALAIRTYFVQPFKIPTGSMEPTLFGYTAARNDIAESTPLWQKFTDFVFLGKTHHFTLASQPGVVEDVRDASFLMFERTVIQVGGINYSVWAPMRQVLEMHPEIARFTPGGKKRYEKGEPIVNFTLKTGDHVFVNKMALHFTRLERGSVMVFTTQGIPGIANYRSSSAPWNQYYIKRCVALGGDQIQIVPPQLLVNGKPLLGREVFDKQYAMSDGYKGYSLRTSGDRPGNYLENSETFYGIKQGDFYWAMGDNSPVSFDSRYWGEVPRDHLVGVALCVFWPFSSRWGIIY